MFATIAVALAATVSGAAQEKVDFDMIEKIQAEGMDRSKVLETFDQLVTVIGPRLTNSPAHKRSVAWTQETLKAWGMSEVHTEPFQFGRGWTMDKVSIEMIEPRYMPMIGYPHGWSPSTAGRLVAAPVWLPGLEADALKAQTGKLKGAIVMTGPVKEYAIKADRLPASGDLKPPQPAAGAPAATDRRAARHAQGRKRRRHDRAQHRRARHRVRHRARHGRRRGARRSSWPPNTTT